MVPKTSFDIIVQRGAPYLNRKAKIHALCGLSHFEDPLMMKASVWEPCFPWDVGPRFPKFSFFFFFSDSFLCNLGPSLLPKEIDPQCTFHPFSFPRLMNSFFLSIKKLNKEMVGKGSNNLMALASNRVVLLRSLSTSQNVYCNTLSGYQISLKTIHSLVNYEIYILLKQHKIAYKCLMKQFTSIKILEL